MMILYFQTVPSIINRLKTCRLITLRLITLRLITLRLITLRLMTCRFQIHPLQIHRFPINQLFHLPTCRLLISLILQISFL